VQAHGGKGKARERERTRTRETKPQGQGQGQGKRKGPGRGQSKRSKREGQGQDTRARYSCGIGQRTGLGRDRRRRVDEERRVPRCCERLDLDVLEQPRALVRRVGAPRDDEARSRDAGKVGRKLGEDGLAQVVDVPAGLDADLSRSADGRVAAPDLDPELGRLPSGRQRPWGPQGSTGSGFSPGYRWQTRARARGLGRGGAPRGRRP
jgi:hypothetical protein